MKDSAEVRLMKSSFHFIALKMHRFVIGDAIAVGVPAKVIKQHKEGFR